MSPTFDQKIALFHRSAIQQMKSAGLSAYILREDGSVIRFKPDGKRELIVSSSAFAESMNQARAHCLHADGKSETASTFA